MTRDATTNRRSAVTIRPIVVGRNGSGKWTSDYRHLIQDGTQLRLRCVVFSAFASGSAVAVAAGPVFVKAGGTPPRGRAAAVGGTTDSLIGTCRRRNLGQ